MLLLPILSLPVIIYGIVKEFRNIGKERVRRVLGREADVRGRDEPVNGEGGVVPGYAGIGLGGVEGIAFILEDGFLAQDYATERKHPGDPSHD